MQLYVMSIPIQVHASHSCRKESSSIFRSHRRRAKCKQSLASQCGIQEYQLKPLNMLQAFWQNGFAPWDQHVQRISLTAQGPISSWPEGFSTGGQDTLQISKRKHVGEHTVLHEPHEPERMVKRSESNMWIPDFDKDFNPRVLTSTGTPRLWPMRRFKSLVSCLMRIGVLMSPLRKQAAQVAVQNALLKKTNIFESTLTTDSSVQKQMIRTNGFHLCTRVGWGGWGGWRGGGRRGWMMATTNSQRIFIFISMFIHIVIISFSHLQLRFVLRRLGQLNKTCVYNQGTFPSQKTEAVNQDLSTLTFKNVAS